MARAYEERSGTEDEATYLPGRLHVTIRGLVRRAEAEVACGKAVEVSGRLFLEGSRRFEKRRPREYLSRSSCRLLGTWSSSRPCRRTCGR